MEKLEETLRCPTSETPVETVETVESRRIEQLCRDSAKKVEKLSTLFGSSSNSEVSIPSNSLGFGSVSQIAWLFQHFAIPVLIQPTEAERTLLCRSGLEVRRLLWVFQFDPSSLYFFFFAASDWQTEKRRLLRGKHRGTRHDALRRTLLRATARAPRAHRTRHRGK